jgi:hypothetical protein
MEDLIKFKNRHVEEMINLKSETGAHLTDPELSVRWWNRLLVEEKQSLLNTYLPSQEVDNMSYETIYWVWKRQQDPPPDWK